MNAQIGRLLVNSSVLVAAIGAVIAFVAGRTRSPKGLKLSRTFAYLYALLMFAATAVMEYALLTHDFSVSYVAHVGSRTVPVWVTIASLWSSLEGSILFWGFVLGAYIAIATFLTRGNYEEYTPDAIGVWLSCAAFFSFLIAGPANPFVTIPNPAFDGPGPNPLLQNHILMVAHPPFLYLGYVGMTIPFGLVTAALIRGRLGHALLKPIRESLMLPWVFQTIAIMLGGWWAYEVLGWGGYWAWDPVENASLLPWLTATAAMHSIILVERRGILKGWTVTLIQATFLLVVLGTFMTRSGVFNSVHSFTQSAIGPAILAFLASALIVSIALLAMRIDRLEAEGNIEGGVFSREGMFLVNNLLLVLFTFTVLIGTVFPLIVEAVRGKQMSVGRPYFDSMVVPIGVTLLFLLGVGPALPWGRAKIAQIRTSLLRPLILAGIFSVAGFVLGVRSIWTLVTLAFGGYALQVAISQMGSPISQLKRARRRFASYIVHAGVVVAIIAIAVSTTMRTQTEVTLENGASTMIAGYTVTLVGTDDRIEPHRESTVVQVLVTKNGVRKTTLEPRMSQYAMMREPIGSPDVYTTAAGDLYLSILSIDPAARNVTLHVIYTPMMLWIWISVLVMGLGGLLSVIPAALTRPRAVATYELQPGLVKVVPS